jgi:transcriptional regulator with XRE-family HTH domain
MSPQSAITPESFPTFGALLRYLRRRAYLTQCDLAIAVGYSLSQICRLEQNQRLPDSTTLAARFIPALGLDDKPELATRLIALAIAAHSKSPAAADLTIVQAAPSAGADLDVLESIPPPPPCEVARPTALARLGLQLAAERTVALCGLAGVGKTTLGAMLARNYAQDAPVFWLTLSAGVNTTAGAIVRQLALFALAHGQEVARPLVRRQDGALPLREQLKLLGTALTQLAGSRAAPPLLCFDNAYLVQYDTQVIQVLCHLCATTPAALLLISREALSAAGVAQIGLEGLAPAEGLALIAQLAGRRGAALAKRLIERTGGHPLLLRLALGLLDSCGCPEELIEQLEGQPLVAAYLAETLLGRLPQPAMRLIEALAVFRRPINLHDAALAEAIQVADGSYDHAAALALVQRNRLIDHSEQARLHPLLRDYVYTTLAADGLRRRRLHRVAAEWSEQIAGDLVEAAHHYCRAGLLAQVAEVLVGQEDTLIRRGQAHIAVAILDEALGQIRRCGDTGGLVRQLLTTRGDLLAGARCVAEAAANYRDALALAAHPSVQVDLVRRMATLRQRGQTSPPALA